MRDDRENLKAELAAYGVKYTQLVTADDEVLSRPDALKWKGEICRDRGVDILFEDSPGIIEHVDDAVLTFVPV